MKIAKIYPRDIIAFFTLIACFILMFFGINSVVSGIAIAIIAFYFSKRLYEERNPNGDLNEKVKKIEEETKEIKSTSEELKSYIPKPMFPGEVILKPSIHS